MEMERRHIAQAKNHIARQEEIVRQFEVAGAENLALQARETLDRFREILAFAEQRLAYLGRSHQSKPPTSN